MVKKKVKHKFSDSFKCVCYGNKCQILFEHSQYNFYSTLPDMEKFAKTILKAIDNHKRKEAIIIESS